MGVTRCEQGHDPQIAEVSSSDWIGAKQCSWRGLLERRVRQRDALDEHPRGK